MNKPSKTDRPRPLKLSRETLRTLSSAELTLAVGGVRGFDSSNVGAYQNDAANAIC